MPTLEEFKRFDLRIAEVLSAVPHPQADRLYIMEIRLGDQTKQIVAGIRAFYRPEELIGKKIVVVDNLEPAMIRGVASNGMLLAAKHGDRLTILVPERDLPSGAAVS